MGNLRKNSTTSTVSNTNMNRYCLTGVLGICLATTVSCSSGDLPAISGQVLVDGAPLDRGTLRLDPVEGVGGARGAGGAVEEGAFQLPAGHGLRPGKYRAQATAFKKTGKTIDDYQRGLIEETVQVDLSNSPQEVELTSHNAKDLKIEFISVRRK